MLQLDLQAGASASKDEKEDALMKMSVDMVACIFLGLALLASIFMHSSAELSNSISCGLIGFMGRKALENAKKEW